MADVPVLGGLAVKPGAIPLAAPVGLAGDLLAASGGEVHAVSCAGPGLAQVAEIGIAARRGVAGGGRDLAGAAGRGMVQIAGRRA